MSCPVVSLAVDGLVDFWSVRCGACLATEVRWVKNLREYLKVAEAAEFVGVSQNTLRKWADQGRITVRVNPANGYRMFRREDLQRFLRDAAKPVRPRKAK